MKPQEDKVTDRYFRVWAMVLPITSVLIVPSIQGTSPNYLMAMFSLLIVMYATRLRGHGNGYIKELFAFLYIWMLFTAAAQLSLSLSNGLDFSSLRLLNEDDTSYLFRSSLFGQSIYLLAAVLTFIYVKNFYKPSWDKYLMLGIVFLALYGLYEVVYFWLFQANGDFLTNRKWDGEHVGSLFQTASVGSVYFLRLKSLTGEPSFYAFTVLPFWIYAIHTRRTKTALLLFVTLLLSTSTTAYLGIAIYAVLRVWYYKLRDAITWITGSLILVLVMWKWEFVTSFYDKFIYSKLAMESISGIERHSSFTASLQFFSNLPIVNMFFGVGFGYVRSPDLFSTLLVNTGMLGVLVFSAVMLWPVFKLDGSYRSAGLKAAAIVVYITSMIACVEFAYLSSWLFLGMAYKQSREKQPATLKKLSQIGNNITSQT